MNIHQTIVSGAANWGDRPAVQPTFTYLLKHFFTYLLRLKLTRGPGSIVVAVAEMLSNRPHAFKPSSSENRLYFIKRTMNECDTVIRCYVFLPQACY